MMRHLIALGHRRIAHIAGPADFATSAQRRSGAAGMQIALAAARIAPDPALVVAGNDDFFSGARAADMLLSLSIPPTAIFAGSDDMAAGALAAAHRLGVAVPGTVSIAGFGDDALAGYVWPPLTTIRQPVRALGWNAADLLLSTEPTTERRELPYELIVRGSTTQPIR